ncbi:MULTISPECIES: polysaccharide lyase family 7 protein [Winogradskyella]|uniref:polysaccharide lyase family 7 protein n=1 Tax=Winogradskyella TaxID=286104 RepID=UPI0015CDAA91|nr:MULTISPECIES: polysaccharide lyase family 7 protein [Winogradskyella]QXP80294.1 polysaccharide lyase family 7 protein [Winogradskyella sp. HaHa_3_26]
MRFKFVYALFFFAILVANCSKSEDAYEEFVFESVDNPDDDSGENDDTDGTFADIDFSNWKVTLPVDENNNGGPDEYQPSSLINGRYRTNSAIQPYMYDDVGDASIEFYTFPNISTTNSSYSRTELRELINPSDSKENWSLLEGGTIEGRLKVVDISEDSESSRQYHRTIVMQIHGILSIEDMSAHGFSSNNGPPLIKMTWIDGDLWVYKKSLIDESTTGDALLDTSSDTWFDEKINMGYVGFEAFDFKITASDARLELQLNDDEPVVYQDVSLEKWPFENYFKAGNYLSSTSESAFSKVKYYELNVTH